MPHVEDMHDIVYNREQDTVLSEEEMTHLNIQDIILGCKWTPVSGRSATCQWLRADRAANAQRETAIDGQSGDTGGQDHPRPSAGVRCETSYVRRLRKPGSDLGIQLVVWDSRFPTDRRKRLADLLDGIGTVGKLPEALVRLYVQDDGLGATIDRQHLWLTGLLEPLDGLRRILREIGQRTTLGGLNHDPLPHSA